MFNPERPIADEDRDMPRKLPRTRDHSDLVPAQPKPLPVADMDPRTALILGTAHVAHGAVTAYGQVTTAVVQTTGEVLSTAIQSFGECFTAYMGYLREKAVTQRVLGVEREITARVLGAEREATARVLGAEREATARVEVWAATVIAESEQQTERLRIQAGVVLATISDNQSRREAKLEVIAIFMREYSAWNHTLRGVLAERSTPMALSERETHHRHIDALLDRARHMEQVISSIAVTL